MGYKRLVLFSVSITMAQTTSVFAADELIAHCDIDGGGSFYRRHKYIRLTSAEWDKLFSVDFDFDNLQPKLPLSENGNNLPSVVAGIEISCNVAFLDVRHCYFNKGVYSPSHAGVKIRKEQWDAIKKWVNSRG